MAQVEVHPKVTVSVNPAKIIQGQMIQINAQIHDTLSGQPMKFDRIYMQILDETGVEVWPLSTIAVNDDHLNKLISTTELEPGKFTVRISPSRKLHPMGANSFEIEKTKRGIIVPLIPLILLAPVTAITVEKIKKEFVEPDSVDSEKIAFLAYKTEGDSRVCPICRPHEGKVFRPDDPNIIKIGPPELGQDTHYGCRCHYDIITQGMVIRKFYQGMLEQREQALQAYQAYEIVQVVKASQKGLKQLQIMRTHELNS